MKLLLPALLGLILLSSTAHAQTAAGVDYSPADYRRDALGNAEHARLVNQLLRYELRNLRGFLRTEVYIHRRTFTYTIQNRATLAEVTGGQYIVRFYDAAGQLLAAEPGHFGHVPPADSQNMEVRFQPPADAVKATMELTELRAE